MVGSRWLLLKSVDMGATAYILHKKTVWLFVAHSG